MAARRLTTAPTTAERIRSACLRGGGAMLAVEGVEPTASAVHHLLDDGSFAVTVPVDGLVAGMVVAAGTVGVPAVLEMTDYAPLPLREPVRSLVWIRGRVQAVPSAQIPGLLDLIAAADPNPALLQVNTARSAPTVTPRLTLVRLEIESVVVADSTGAEAVGVGALLQAAPDPFCAMESCWLQHLEVAHRDVIDRLADRLPSAASAGTRPPARARPVRRAAAGGERRRRSRRPVGVRQARRRRHRAQPGDPDPDGLPVPQRACAGEAPASLASVSAPEELTEADRRALRIEIAVVLAVTFGLSAYTAILDLVEAILLNLSKQTVALNPRLSPFDLINLGLNLARVAQLVAWGALGVYLLWRSGIGLSKIGLGRIRWRSDVLGGLGLAALIGLPGLGLYVAARALGMSVSVVPSTHENPWWHIPVLILLAFANGWAEEVIVVGFLLTRLQQLRVNPVVALVATSLLRGAYHLYQGWGAGLGNAAMGLVFGYAWRRTGRLWPLVIAHGVIDTVAFVGYILLAGHLGWLK